MNTWLTNLFSFNGLKFESTKSATTKIGQYYSGTIHTKEDAENCLANTPDGSFTLWGKESSTFNQQGNVTYDIIISVVEKTRNEHPTIAHDIIVGNLKSLNNLMNIPLCLDKFPNAHVGVVPMNDSILLSRPSQETTPNQPNTIFLPIEEALSNIHIKNEQNMVAVHHVDQDVEEVEDNDYDHRNSRRSVDLVLQRLQPGFVIPRISDRIVRSVHQYHHILHTLQQSGEYYCELYYIEKDDVHDTKHLVIDSREAIRSLQLEELFHMTFVKQDLIIPGGWEYRQHRHSDGYQNSACYTLPASSLLVAINGITLWNCSHEHRVELLFQDAALPLQLEFLYLSTKDLEELRTIQQLMSTTPSFQTILVAQTLHYLVTWIAATMPLYSIAAGTCTSALQSIDSTASFRKALVPLLSGSGPTASGKEIEALVGELNRLADKKTMARFFRPHLLTTLELLCLVDYKLVYRKAALAICQMVENEICTVEEFHSTVSRLYGHSDSHPRMAACHVAVSLLRYLTPRHQICDDNRALDLGHDCMMEHLNQRHFLIDTGSLLTRLYTDTDSRVRSELHGIFKPLLTESLSSPVGWSWALEFLEAIASSVEVKVRLDGAKFCRLYLHYLDTVFADADDPKKKQRQKRIIDVCLLLMRDMNSSIRQQITADFMIFCNALQPIRVPDQLIEIYDLMLEDSNDDILKAAAQMLVSFVGTLPDAEVFFSTSFPKLIGLLHADMQRCKCRGTPSVYGSFHEIIAIAFLQLTELPRVSRAQIIQYIVPFVEQVLAYDLHCDSQFLDRFRRKATITSPPTSPTASSSSRKSFSSASTVSTTTSELLSDFSVHSHMHVQVIRHLDSLGYRICQDMFLEKIIPLFSNLATSSDWRVRAEVGNQLYPLYKWYQHDEAMFFAADHPSKLRTVVSTFLRDPTDPVRKTAFQFLHSCLKQVQTYQSSTLVTFIITTFDQLLYTTSQYKVRLAAAKFCIELNLLGSAAQRFVFHQCLTGLEHCLEDRVVNVQDCVNSYFIECRKTRMWKEIGALDPDLCADLKKACKHSH